MILASQFAWLRREAEWRMVLLNFRVIIGTICEDVDRWDEPYFFQEMRELSEEYLAWDRAHPVESLPEDSSA